MTSTVADATSSQPGRLSRGPRSTATFSPSLRDEPQQQRSFERRAMAPPRVWEGGRKGSGPGDEPSPPLSRIHPNQPGDSFLRCWGQGAVAFQFFAQFPPKAARIFRPQQHPKARLVRAWAAAPFMVHPAKPD